MKLQEVHLIHAVPEPGRGGTPYLWFSVDRGYDLELADNGDVIVRKGQFVRGIGQAAVLSWEPLEKPKAK